jgi:AraC-like DNA-binding protein
MIRSSLVIVVYDMSIQRLPSPVLRPFVRLLWAMDESTGSGPIAAAREHVLPTGAMHLVFRLSDHPLRLYQDAEDTTGRIVGREVVGGARAGFYIRDVTEPVSSVGVQLLPGAAELLFGVPAGELAERHTRLDDLWGRAAGEARERLEEAGSLSRRLEILESLLLARLPAVRGLHPAVAQALEQFLPTTDVREVVRASGYSHRHFIGLFRDAVGLAPKAYARVLRFQNVLQRFTSDPRSPWVETAIDAGYSDQPHFTREFRDFTGLTPEQYRKVSPLSAHHVPVSPLSRHSRDSFLKGQISSRPEIWRDV